MPQRALAERGNVPAGSPHPMQRAKPARHTAPSPPSSWPAAARAVVLLELPLELLLELCARMGSDDLARLAQSCRAARAVAYHPALWRACVLRLPRTPLAALAGLRSRLAQSTALELRPCSCTTAAHGSRCIAEACPRLDPALDHLASCGTLSAAAALEPIVRMAPRLEQLSLCGMVHLSFAGFVGILRACPELRVLNARGCLRLAQLTPAEAAASEVRTPHAQLRELDLSRTWATSAGVGAVLRHAPQLARLKLNFCERCVPVAWARRGRRASPRLGWLPPRPAVRPALGLLTPRARCSRARARPPCVPQARLRRLWAEARGGGRGREPVRSARSCVRLPRARRARGRDVCPVPARLPAAAEMRRRPGGGG